MGSSKLLSTVIAVCLFTVCVPANTARADDLAIRYEILGIQNGPEDTTLTLKIQLFNLTGVDKSNLSLEILTVMSSITSREEFSISKLSPNRPEIFTANFTVPADLPPSQVDALLFLVTQHAAAGDSSTAVIQGHQTVLMGDVIP